MATNLKNDKALPLVRPGPIRIILADNKANFRHAVKVLMEVDGDIKVIGQARDGLAAVALARMLKPDIVVMDIGMPIMNGLEAAKKILESNLGIRVVMLSAHPDPEYIRQAMNLGASGYIVKQTASEFLAKAIRDVSKGAAYFSKSISKHLRDECQLVFAANELSKRELLKL